MKAHATTIPIHQTICFATTAVVQVQDVVVPERFGTNRVKHVWRIPFRLQTPTHLMSTWMDVWGLMTSLFTSPILEVGVVRLNGPAGMI